METISSKKLTKMIVGALILLTSIELLVAKAPDNAALLYYQAFMVYQEPENQATLKAMSDLLKGGIQPSEVVSKYLKRNQRAIDLVLTAAEIPDCDWGLDFSQGTSMQMPYLSPHRRVSKIILADARILAAQGHHRMALSRCLTAYKMAAHAGDDMIISFLMGTSTKEMANECIQAILSELPQDRQTLNWLKKELAKVEKESLTLAGLKTSIENDFKSTMIDLTKDRVEKILSVVFELVSLGPANNPPKKQKSDGQENTESSSCDLGPKDFEQIAVERIRAGDEHFFERNRIYWQNYMARLISTLDFPYAQAYIRLKELGDKPQKDAIENPDASLTAILAPACHPVYHYQVKHNTFYNAILTAVDIYLIKARTGRLPDMLPIGSPKDLFSGKDFKYKRKDDSFMLRCQGKDLHRDKVHQYKFTVKK